MFKDARWYQNNSARLREEEEERKAKIYNSLSKLDQTCVDALHGVSFSIYGPKGKREFKMEFNFDTKEFDCRCISSLGFFESTLEYKKEINGWVYDRLKDYGVPFKTRFWYYIHYCF